MPGVPSGKGCDACIKQKKKCDQVKPACSRCARLQIPCIGSGKQRYKFKQVNAGAGRTSPPSSEDGRRRASRESSCRTLSRTPSSESAVLLSELINKLEVKDIRFDLCWAYGNLLKEIPSRLGRNTALDASVVALTTACSDLGSRRKPHHALIKYGAALTALRSVINDSALASAPETLCAIYVIWICQSWIGEEVSSNIGHGAGIVQILATAPYRHSKDPFEKMLLATIAAPVIFESLFNPDVQLNPWVIQYVLDIEQPILSEDELKKLGPTAPGRPQIGRTMSCIVRLPDFMRYNPELLYEIRENYTAVQETSKILRDKFTAAAAAMSEQNPEINYKDLKLPKAVMALIPMRMHAFYQRIYAIYLSLQVMLNGILRAYDPDDMLLMEESDQMCGEIISLCHQAAMWKPMGAGWIPLALVAAYSATMDPLRSLEVSRVWNDLWREYMPQAIGTASFHSYAAFDNLRSAAMRGRSLSPYSVASFC